MMGRRIHLDLRCTSAVMTFAFELSLAISPGTTLASGMLLVGEPLAARSSSFHVMHDVPSLTERWDVLLLIAGCW